MKAFFISIPLLAGFLIDLILGDPYTLPHPVRAIGNLIARFEKFVRKKFPDNLRIGGLFLVVTVLLITSGIIFAILFFAYKINFWLGIAVESIMCYYLIAPKCLRDESMIIVYSAPKSHNIPPFGSRTASINLRGIIVV